MLKLCSIVGDELEITSPTQAWVILAICQEPMTIREILKEINDRFKARVNVIGVIKVVDELKRSGTVALCPTKELKSGVMAQTYCHVNGDGGVLKKRAKEFLQNNRNQTS